VSARLIEPGSVLADRYLVEDLLIEEGSADSWRAFDQMLARSVVLQILPSSSPYAERLLNAAKRASHVTDPRILQVLDAVNDGRLTYVVREWVSGQTLDVLLAEGPLPARRAASIIRDLAAAIAHAHELGVVHHRLAPDTVVVTKDGGVKVLGLGTSAALQPDFNGDAMQHDDAIALGQILYACLTARWPGLESTSLPPAPKAHGQCLRPRQVRAGVPRALDKVCDRILSRPSRYGPPLTTAAQIRDELTQILSADGRSGSTDSRGISGSVDPLPAAAAPTHPALLQRGAGEGEPAGAPLPGATPARPRRPSLPSRLIWIVLAVLVAGTSLLAYLVGQQGTHSPPTHTSPPGSASTPTPVPLHPVPISNARSFDPYPGSGDENPDLVPLAIDGNRATAWQTLTYYNNPALGGEKSGVGLLLDLGRVHDVRLVTVDLEGTGTSLQLRAAPASAAVAPSDSDQQYRLLGTVSDAGSSAVFRLKQPVSTRYLLVWLTRLPPEGANSFRGGVAEVKVLG
jgi:serine/threonine protein kinase